ncbi:MAG: hypothetical protein IKD04_01410 [Clostridia bacterium]|nr:hypothetical protein [Clostridia bacterium]
MNFKKNIIAFLVIGLLGTVGHFVYDWSGENSILGLIFPVSESVWEHLKLLFFPTIIYSSFEYLFSHEKPRNYLAATAIGLFCGLATVIVIYYLVNGIVGYDISFINITSYYIAVIVLLCKKRTVILKEKFYSKNANIFFAVLLGVTALLFFIWSYNPPSLGIFTPPITV